MVAQTSMLHVRVDDHLKTQAADALEAVGLTLSDAVRIFLTRVAHEGGLPAGLVTEPRAYDAWFRTAVLEAIADQRQASPHVEVMAEMREMIELSCCRFRGHEDKIVAHEPERGHDETEVQPRVQDRDREAGDGSGYGGGAGRP